MFIKGLRIHTVWIGVGVDAHAYTYWPHGRRTHRQRLAPQRGWSRSERDQRTTPPSVAALDPSEVIGFEDDAAAAGPT